jgi:hypothetical protein
MVFSGALKGPHGGQGGGIGWARLWPSGWRTVLCCMGLASLMGCSAVRLVYNQAATLAYWNLDQYVDFTSSQSVAIRQDIATFFTWHRSQALPVYADLLQHWGTLSQRDTTADEVCAQYALGLQQVPLLTAQMEAPLVRTALEMNAAQIAQLQKRQRKTNKEYEKDFLQPDAQDRLDTRLDKSLGYFEQLYGNLTTAQRTLLRKLLEGSAWDPQRSYAERLALQENMVQTVLAMQADPPNALALLRQHLNRYQQSTTPGYAQYRESVVRSGCAIVAQVHNSTNAEQRAQATKVMKRYETDFRTLHAQR